MGQFLRAVLIVGSCLAAVNAHARLNLPQTTLRITVDARTAALLQNPGAQLPSGAEAGLLAALPEDLRNACADVVERWGNAAGGSQQWSVRLLYAGQGSAWLAFRCGSRLPQFARFYDERLAAFHAASRALQFLAFDRDSNSDPQLYHVFFWRPLAVPGRQLPAFRLALPPGNPCCTAASAAAGPIAVAIASEERLLICNDAGGRPAEALSLVTQSDVIEQDNKAGDTRTIYNATTRVQRAMDRNVLVIAVDFREEINGRPERQGTLRYAWNPAAGRFEKLSD